MIPARFSRPAAGTVQASPGSCHDQQPVVQYALHGGDRQQRRHLQAVSTSAVTGTSSGAARSSPTAAAD